MSFSSHETINNHHEKINLNSPSLQAKPNFFVKFHGRMVNLLTPLPSKKPLLELAKRIGCVFAAIFVYPAWGIAILANKMRLKNEPINDLPQSRVAAINPPVEETTVEAMVKKSLTESGNEWKHREGLKGDEVKIFAGFEIKNPHTVERKIIKNCVVKNDSQTVESYIKNFYELIKSYIGSTYGKEHELYIQIIVVGDNAQNDDFIDFQRIVTGYSCSNNTLHKIDNNPGWYTTMVDEFIKTQFSERLQVPEFPWDENGKIKKTISAQIA